jgi:hypothetical protein
MYSCYQQAISLKAADTLLAGNRDDPIMRFEFLEKRLCRRTCAAKAWLRLKGDVYAAGTEWCSCSMTQ